jgi:glycosyltransferase involved in cell wall biosynthesis
MENSSVPMLGDFVTAKSAPKISVLIHSYNFEKYLRESIESVLAQTLAPFEIIVCDDCSTDDSWKIITEYKQRYPKLIRCYRHEKNLGMTKNAAFAWKAAAGDLISAMDGDDRWMPDKLRLEWSALERNPEARIAYSNVHTIDDDGRRTGVWYDGEGAPPPSGDVFVQMYCGTCFPNRMDLYRHELMYRSVFEEVGDFDETVEIFIDLDYKLRATARFCVAYSGEALVEFRIHDRGIHNSPFKRMYGDLLYVLMKNLHLVSSRSTEEASQIFRGIAERALSCVDGVRRAADDRLALIGRLEAVARERLLLIENLDAENVSLRGTCDERLRLINELDSIAKERLDVIERLTKETNRRYDV